MALLVADRAREQPGDIGLRDDRVALTWAELNGLLNRVANGLHRLELGADRRIAVYAENAVETVVAHLGGLLAGASSVPVNFHLTTEEVAYILKDSGAAVVFVGPETAERGISTPAPVVKRHSLSRLFARPEHATDAYSSRFRHQA